MPESKRASEMSHLLGVHISPLQVENLVTSLFFYFLSVDVTVINKLVSVSVTSLIHSLRHVRVAGGTRTFTFPEASK